MGRSNKKSAESIFPSKFTSNEIFVFNAFSQNWKKLDIRVFSGQIRAILTLKNYSAFASNHFYRLNFAFSKIFPIGIKKIECIFALKRTFNKVRRKKIRVVAVTGILF